MKLQQPNRQSVIAMLALISALLAPGAMAFFCPPTPDIAEALGAADAVFSGVVVGLTTDPYWAVSLDKNADCPPCGRQLHVVPKDRSVALCDTLTVVAELEVLEVWKGEFGKRITVTTYSQVTIGGFPFKLGESYLVYARQIPEGDLSVSNCSRTTLLAEAVGEVAELGPPTHESWQREALKIRQVFESE